MKIKRDAPKVADALKGSLKKGERLVTLKDLDSNYIIGLLEENIRLRETPIEGQIKKRLVFDKSKDLNKHQLNKTKKR